ncbi:hypothetical protein [Rhizobium sp. BK176]|uniref:hypothetical protein n=1 Tax=Rhizobium sp. BK176 TaxID=2587071 RepID=UPI00216949F4|nr:hypothetical protein [Rhizobium sp. BK176]MCS4090039.1 hypothetical protein [Rhizobium sp. BK176]
MHDLKAPLPSVFVANLLENGASLNFSDNADASAYIVANAIKDLGGQPITEPSPEANMTIARMMAAETIWNVTHSDEPTSLNWYTQSIEDMIGVAALMHPEIKSDAAAASHRSGLFRDAREAQTVFFAAIAITSQNNKVNENMRYALEQYRHFIETGSFSVDRIYGANGAAIKYNLERFNTLYGLANKDLTRVHRLLTMKMRMADLKSVAAKYGMKITASELADEMVWGSVIFGPKIGNGFFQNLIGNHTPVTIDLWFMRTWGRYTGSLVRGGIVDGALEKLEKGIAKSMRSPEMRALMEEAGVAIDPKTLRTMDSQSLFSYARSLRLFWEGIRRAYVAGKVKDDMSSKSRRVTRSNEAASTLKQNLGWPLAAESIASSLGYPVDSPKSAGHRKWIREVVSLALDIMERQGYRMTAADMQASLWFPEKSIYGVLTGRSPEAMNTSYDEAMIRIAKNEGYTDDDISKALRANGNGRRTGRAVPEADQRRFEGERVRLFG